MTQVEWTEHDGGGCPVPDHVRVVARNANKPDALFGHVEVEAGLLKWANVTHWKLA